MNDKMREKFEEYMNGQGFDFDHIYINGEFKCYCFAATQSAFDIWKAGWEKSRAVQCVELPLAFSDERATTYLTRVTNALDSVGVRYK